MLFVHLLDTFGKKDVHLLSFCEEKNILVSKLIFANVENLFTLLQIMFRISIYRNFPFGFMQKVRYYLHLPVFIAFHQ